MKNLEPIIQHVVTLMPKEFSTHSLIIELAKNHQHEYISALHGELDSSRPFQNLHSKIGRHLKTLSIVTNIDEQKVIDMDIWGNSSSNALWTKN